MLLSPSRSFGAFRMASWTIYYGCAGTITVSMLTAALRETSLSAVM
jgi:hypothetical protein